MLYFATVPELIFNRLHGKYKFTEKQERLMQEKEIQDLFSADIRDRIRDFEKSLI